MLTAIVFIMPVARTPDHALEIFLPQGFPDLENPWDYPDPGRFSLPPFVTVHVDEADRVLFNSVPVALGEVGNRIRAARMELPIVVFSADANASYGTSAIVLNEIAKAGVHPGDICLSGLEEHRHFEAASAFIDAPERPPRYAGYVGSCWVFDLKEYA